MKTRRKEIAIHMKIVTKKYTVKIRITIITQDGEMQIITPPKKKKIPTLQDPRRRLLRVTPPGISNPLRKIRKISILKLSIRWCDALTATCC